MVAAIKLPIMINRSVSLKTTISIWRRKLLISFNQNSLLFISSYLDRIYRMVRIFSFFYSFVPEERKNEESAIAEVNTSI
jgi:hypothetical protein